MTLMILQSFCQIIYHGLRGLFQNIFNENNLHILSKKTLCPSDKLAMHCIIWSWLSEHLMERFGICIRIFCLGVRMERLNLDASPNKRVWCEYEYGRLTQFYHCCLFISYHIQAPLSSSAMTLICLYSYLYFLCLFYHLKVNINVFNTYKMSSWVRGISKTNHLSNLSISFFEHYIYRLSSWRILSGQWTEMEMDFSMLKNIFKKNNSSRDDAWCPLQIR